MTDDVLLKIIKNKELIHFNDSGQIVSVHFYDDLSNPTNQGGDWKTYFDVIKSIGHYEVDNK